LIQAEQVKQFAWMKSRFRDSGFERKGRDSSLNLHKRARH